jgi:hypothetical protein
VEFDPSLSPSLSRASALISDTDFDCLLNIDLAIVFADEGSSLDPLFSSLASLTLADLGGTERSGNR